MGVLRVSALSEPRQIKRDAPHDHGAQQIVRFDCWHSDTGILSGWATVHRAPLTEPDTGRWIAEGFTIRWTFIGDGKMWEQTTLSGKQAIKAAAAKVGWSL